MSAIEFLGAESRVQACARVFVLERTIGPCKFLHPPNPSLPDSPIRDQTLRFADQSSKVLGIPFPVTMVLTNTSEANSRTSRITRFRCGTRRNLAEIRASAALRFHNPIPPMQQQTHDGILPTSSPNSKVPSLSSPWGSNRIPESLSARFCRRNGYSTGRTHRKSEVQSARVKLLLSWQVRI